jgi:hypothetical protein
MRDRGFASSAIEAQGLILRYNRPATEFVDSGCTPRGRQEQQE